MDRYECRLCPRQCLVDREHDLGYCGQGLHPKAARAALHLWEEPCISGTRGSGTVFFTGCTLRCVFCQNHTISCEGLGKEISETQLARIFLQLQAKGAHNINLVTATQFLPSVMEALSLARPQLTIPVVYNTSGYERLETLELLRGQADVFLPDLKYFDPGLSARYSKASDYFSVASKAIPKMLEMAGPPILDEEGIMKKGVIIRHMVLPGQRADSIRLLEWMAQQLPKEAFYISLLSQYTPFYKSLDYPEISRRITTYEYQTVVDAALRLGLSLGYMQEKSSAREEYTPPFDLEGIN